MEFGRQIREKVAGIIFKKHTHCLCKHNFGLFPSSPDTLAIGGRLPDILVFFEN